METSLNEIRIEDFEIIQYLPMPFRTSIPMKLVIFAVRSEESAEKIRSLIDPSMWIAAFGGGTETQKFLWSELTVEDFVKAHIMASSATDDVPYEAAMADRESLKQAVNDASSLKGLKESMSKAGWRIVSKMRKDLNGA
ncbi:uncharacterized protein CELE_Y111B2A.21 [Caenorhabditis elegans]|uniref:Uncharacterized protein n=1 Tax=Caenorhabditis elegans TaxID=6239 RepID=Q9NEL0_CAEEL|nr:Uncharacterized protein CELE_Y111B2A.21 [Caenorhabditis elegans]CAC35850.2 Uncharacterized protein CELE_Y111B2A.21 [Caenorhabditis elegans]|eukprot:NP_499655.2 Uncharacterized protein CELE_Y111B2A.21 [Caenorhabditis elegans]